MREAQLVHDILLAWGSHPRVRIARTNTGKAFIKGRWVSFGVPGTADICGLIGPSGRFIMIEAKSSTGRQREAQVVMARVVTSMGGAYCLARSLADADRFFAAMGITRA